MIIKAEPGKNVIWISVRMAFNSSGDFFCLEIADNAYNGIDLNLILLEDPASGSLIYINAGHEPPLVLGEQGMKARLEPTGPAVGLLQDLEFGLAQIDLQPGDNLLDRIHTHLNDHIAGSNQYDDITLLSIRRN